MTSPEDDLTLPRDEAESADLHDVQEEAGDEAEIDDTYVLDRVEAQEAGVALDPLDEQESPLD